MHPIRDNIRRAAIGPDFSEGKHCRQKGICISADDLLERGDQRGSQDNGVNGKMGLRAMAPPAFDGKIQLISGGHEHTLLEPDLAGCQLGLHMLAINDFRVRIFKDALLNNERRAAG